MKIRNRPNPSRNTALVLGAGAGLGVDIAAALIRHGWNVTTPARQIDMLRDRALFEAARSAHLIVHAVDTPLGIVTSEGMRQIERTIDIASLVGARILLPGTLDNFGSNAPALLDERAPQEPMTTYGAMCVAIEHRLREASTQGIKSAVLRAGDLFGPRIRQSPLTRILLAPGRAVRSISYPGPAGVGHSWAYAPDVAEAFALLAAHEAELTSFDTYHFAGHWDANGAALIDAIGRATRQPRLKRKPFHWSLVRTAAPLDASLRALLETEYRWRVPLRLDNRKLLGLLGTEPHTELDQAVFATLRALRCL